MRVRHSGWLLNVLWMSWRMGQPAPTNLAQRRLVSYLSLYGPLSLCVCFFLSTLPRGFVLLLTLPRGFLFLFAHPTGFALSLSSLCLCLVLSPPPLLAVTTQTYPRSHGGVLSNVQRNRTVFRVTKFACLKSVFRNSLII